MGLPMCRSIVDKHGGSLELVRSAVYEGAHFEASIPLVTNEKSSVAELSMAKA
ncbi:MAG TPA: hypothetical protein DDZ51_23015 [Planctomycetaceae bacterium]|nr:hypothetical protein [Planctomycetaceae bacterium]